MSIFTQAQALLQEFKGDSYLYGVGALAKVGEAAVPLGNRAALVRSTFPGTDDFVATIHGTLADAGVTLAGEIVGASPNAPREDLFRITEALRTLDGIHLATAQALRCDALATADRRMRAAADFLGIPLLPAGE